MRTKKHKATEEESRSVDVTALLARLAFTPESIVGAAVEHTQLFLQAIDYRMAQLDAKNAAESRYEVIRAEKAAELRKDALLNGEKLTENGLTEKLLLSLTVSSAAKRLTDAQRNDEYSKLLLEAMRTRKDCIRFVADLTTAEHMVRKAAEVGAEKVTAARDKLHAKYPGGRTE